MYCFISSRYGDGVLSPWHLPISVHFHFEIPILNCHKWRKVPNVLHSKLQNFCRVWYAGTTILNICINETRQYYRNAYLREIWNCFFHAQTIFQLKKTAVLYLQVWRQTDENWHDSGTQIFRHTIFDKRGAILWWHFEELLKVFTWLVAFRSVSFLNFCVSFHVLVISYRCTVLSYFVPTKTRPTYICTLKHSDDFVRSV
jgi:hypothetical protein